MVQYKQLKFRELEGEYPATITEIFSEPNQYYDESKENSTEENLTIKFVLTDPETNEEMEHTQRFVSPLVGGKTLFQQLCDAAGVNVSEDGGKIDEKKFDLLPVIVTMGKNKKGYNTVLEVAPRDVKGGKPSKSEVDDVFGPSKK